MKNSVIALFFLFSFALCSAQGNSVRKGFTSGKDIFGTRFFIQNKGQFSNSTKSDLAIKYGFEHNGENIYFTNSGLIYKLIEKIKITEEEWEEIEHGEAEIKTPKVCFVCMTWENCNTNIEIIESEKQNHYFTSGGPELNSDCFKTITYKNVYNNIDFEYTIPKAKEYGIKYNIILHPGAKLSDIKLKYTGDLKNISMVKGDIVIETSLNNITEHAPKTFDHNNKLISSSFILKNNTIGFSIENYNASNGFTIDPWVTAISSFTPNTSAYDVDYDQQGNLYAFGGNSPNIPNKLAKYDPAGLLLWTFSGVLSVPVWNSLGSSPGAGVGGNFVVNYFTGEAYICQLLNVNNSQVIRLKANGNYDNFVSMQSPIYGDYAEIWDMCYDRISGKIYCLGGCAFSNKSVSILNPINGAVSPFSLVPAYSSCCQDVSSHAIDDNGNVFIYFSAGTPFNNHIAKMNTAFTSTLWSAPSTYTTMTEVTNRNFYVGTSSGFGGFNSMATNSNYYYFYDGYHLAAYNKANGAKIASGIIPTNAAMYQGGIAVDDCDNIYVGGNGNIGVYNFDGSFFNTVSTISLGISTPNKYVYDIKLDRIRNLLYVCGSGFVGTYTVQPCSQYSVSTSCAGNNNGTAVVTLTTAISSPTFNYTWVNNTGTISTTSSSLASDTLKNLTFGTYTVYIQTNAPNGPVIPYTFSLSCVPCSVSASVNVSCGPGVTTNLNLVSSSGFVSTPTYTWLGPSSYSSTGSPNISFLSGNVYGAYTLTAKDETCTYSTVVNTYPLPAYSPSISTVSVACYGGSTGYALVGLYGGSSPYTYSWSTTPTQTINSAGLIPAGIYTCTITDGLGCVTTETAQVTEPPASMALSLTINSTTLACANSVITMNGIASGGNFPYTYSWTPGPTTYSYNVWQSTPGVYTYSLKVTDAKGCTNTQTINLSFVALPAVSVTLSSPTNTVCTGQTVTLTANGASTYTWNSSIVAGSIVVTPTANISYFLLGTDVNGCLGSITTFLYVTTCTGLNETLQSEDVISIYPNPNKGQFTISLSSLSEKIKVEIFNALGEKIVQISLVQNKTDVSLIDYPSGLYLIRFISENNIVSSKKVIKD